MSGAVQNAVHCAVLDLHLLKNSDFPFEGDVGEPEELFIQGWGPGAGG